MTNLHCQFVIKNFQTNKKWVPFTFSLGCTGASRVGPTGFLTTGQAHVTTELGHGCCGLNNPEVGRWFFLTTGLASIGGLLVSFNNWARVLQKKK